MFKVDELVRVTGGTLLGAKSKALIRGVSIDSRTLKKGDVFIPIKGKNFDGHAFIAQAIKKGASCVIAERGSDVCAFRKVACIKVKDTTKALGTIAAAYREAFNIPVIVVTGSNGKTTTKDMIAWVLGKRYRVLKNEGTKNNHIGLPMTLLQLNRSYDAAVLEAGTNHPGEIEYLARICKPTVAVITNVGQSHLAFLKSVQGVFREKTTLLRHLKAPRMGILNADDPLLGKLIHRRGKDNCIMSFGIAHKADFRVSRIKRSGSAIEFMVNEKYPFTLPSIGYNNIYNALAAISCGRIFGLGYKEIASRLANFVFPQSRLNLVTLKRIRFINDTYNSNPSSLKQALDALTHYPARGRKIFIMGDMMELGNGKARFHYEAGQNAARVCDVLVTVGALSKNAAQAAKKSCSRTKHIFMCSTAQQAKEILLKGIVLSPDDIILVKGSRSMAMEEVFKF